MKESITAKELLYSKESVYTRRDAAHVKAAYDYAEQYKQYLDASKTEREAVEQAILLAEQHGYTEYSFGDKLMAGDKRYYNNRGKNLYLFTIGSEPIRNGIRITAAHVDAPRLDIKQCPLYEEGTIPLKSLPLPAGYSLTWGESHCREPV
jgi:aspartyl aminopeptidase